VRGQNWSIVRGQSHRRVQAGCTVFTGLNKLLQHVSFQNPRQCSAVWQSLKPSSSEIPAKNGWTSSSVVYQAQWRRQFKHRSPGNRFGEASMSMEPCNGAGCCSEDNAPPGGGFVGWPNARSCSIRLRVASLGSSSTVVGALRVRLLLELL